MSLRIDPNPLKLKKSSRDGSIKGSVRLINTYSRNALFQLSFDSDEFCAISPACGELEAGAERPLSLFIEATDEDSLEFTVKFVCVEPGTSQEQITDLMMREAEWTDSVTGKIQFTSHVEDVMQSVKSALKGNRVPVEQAILKSQSRDLDEEQIALMEESLRKKEATRDELRNKVEELTGRVAKQKKRLEELKNKPDFTGQFALIALLMFLFALFVRVVFK